MLPLPILLDRNRGGAYLSLLIAGAGMFGLFLFLTYYLQDTVGYSPVITGIAFLPMVACIVISANASNIILMPRFGPKPIVASGMLAAAAAMAWLTRIGIHASYATAVLPGLMTAGAGIGLIVAPSINTGTYGGAPSDAGVASALVNTSQQVGGSIGVALLNTIAASAAASYLSAHISPRGPLVGQPDLRLTALAQVHGYTIAFWWSAAIFAADSVIAGTLLRRGPLTPPRTQPQHDTQTPGASPNRPPAT